MRHPVEAYVFSIFRQKTSSLIFQKDLDLRNEIWQVVKITGTYRQAMSEVARSCLMNTERSSAKDSASR